MRRAPTIPCAISLVIAACGPSARPVPDREPQPVVTPARVEPSVTPAPAATAMAPSCTEGTLERCDAVDQNCDGRIDEGCGYEPGPLQVTMAWNSDADVDLRVTGPAGEVLPRDREDAGACGDTSRDRIENVHAPAPTAGRYEVALRYASECEQEIGTTTATVSIAASGRVLGVYNVSLEPGAEVPVATVELP